MKRLSFIEIRLKIVSFLRTSGSVRIAEEFYYWMQETGLERLEAKTDFRISVRDVKENKERENKVGCTFRAAGHRR